MTLKGRRHVQDILQCKQNPTEKGQNHALQARLGLENNTTNQYLETWVKMVQTDNGQSQRK